MSETETMEKEVDVERNRFTWSDLSWDFKVSLLRIYGMISLTYFAQYIAALVASLVVFFTIFDDTQTGQAALLLSQLQLVTNGIGVLSLNFGGHVSDHFGRKPFLILKSIFRLLAVAVVLVFEPTPGLLFVSAFFLGLGFWTGAVIPATIYDVCDPKYETQFNHAYAWSTVPLSIGAGLGGIMGGVVAGLGPSAANISDVRAVATASATCNISVTSEVQEVGSYVAVGYAAITAYLLEMMYIIFVYQETLKKENRKESESIFTMLRESFYLPLVTVWSSFNFVLLEICHICNKFSTVGALPLIIAILVYRLDLNPQELAFFTLLSGVFILGGTIWNLFMLPRLGFTLYLSQCFFCGIFWMIGLAFSLDVVSTVIIVCLGAFVVSVSAPLRTLFAWQVAPNQRGLAMAGYDSVDLFAEAVSNFGLTALFAAIVTPNCFARGSEEARNDLSAGTPLLLCAFAYVIAFSAAFFGLRHREKDGRLRPELGKETKTAVDL